MFDSILKYFRKEKPEFNALKQFAFKDKYFYRTANWSWLNKKEIYVRDPFGPRFITMGDWLQIIFLDAKGKITVTEYIDYLASCYTSKIPSALDETVIEELTKLVELKLVEYSDFEITLDKNILEPTLYKKE